MIENMIITCIFVKITEKTTSIIEFLRRRCTATKTNDLKTKIRNEGKHIFSASVFLINILSIMTSQTAFTCSKLTIETIEQGVKYDQS